nr:MAG TPA: hypothetical protein [Caudoviricetes sp.]
MNYENSIDGLIERLKAKDFERDYDCTPFECGVFSLLDDAADTLSTLHTENETFRADVVRFNDLLASYQNVLVPELRAELEQVKRERDVAIEQLHGHCPACAHYTPNHNEGLCRFCCFEVARNTNVEINDNWE